MSADLFAALDVPRRPWIDADDLKDRFHRLTAEHHPDVTGDPERFTALNAAYATLRDPGARLRHLLELEAPGEVIASNAPISPALADRFMQAASLKRELAAFLGGRAATSAPLARALAASEGASLQRRAEQMLSELEASREQCLAAVRDEDAAWAHRDANTFARLASLHRELSFLNRWADQLRESLLQLSL